MKIHLAYNETFVSEPLFIILQHKNKPVCIREPINGHKIVARRCNNL